MVATASLSSVMHAQCQWKRIKNVIWKPSSLLWHAVLSYFQIPFMLKTVQLSEGQRNNMHYSNNQAISMRLHFLQKKYSFLMLGVLPERHLLDSMYFSQKSCPNFRSSLMSKISNYVKQKEITSTTPTTKPLQCLCIFIKKKNNNLK